MPDAERGPTITAMFQDGPLAGRSIETEVLEGRPPILDSGGRGGMASPDGGSGRRCLMRSDRAASANGDGPCSPDELCGRSRLDGARTTCRQQAGAIDR